MNIYKFSYDDKEDAIKARLEGEERFFGKYRKDGK